MIFGKPDKYRQVHRSSPIFKVKWHSMLSNFDGTPTGFAVYHHQIFKNNSEVMVVLLSFFAHVCVATGIINHHEYTRAQVRPECHSLVPAWYCHKALIKHIVYSPTASRPSKATLSGSLELAAPISTLMSKNTSISISFTTFSDQQFERNGYWCVTLTYIQNRIFSVYTDV